jgi:hypothetical protein
MEELDVVQWVAGSGNGQLADWTWLYRKIDDLGKGQIRGGRAEQLRRIHREHRNPGLFYHLSAGSRAEAEDCLAEWEQYETTR